MKYKLFTKNAKIIKRSAREIFTINKTFFLFHLSTYTPAITPNIMDGIIIVKTTIAEAVFE